MTLPPAIIAKAPNLARAIVELQRIESGDALPHWEGYPTVAQDEMLAFVLAILEGKSPESQRERWLVDMLMAGWKLGPEYNATLKTHPRMMHWADDSVEIRSNLTRAGNLVSVLAFL